jgi:hypothetical protein
LWRLVGSFCFGWDTDFALSIDSPELPGRVVLFVQHWTAKFRKAFMLASQIASAVTAGDPRLRSTSSLSGDLCHPGGSLLLFVKREVLVFGRQPFSPRKNEQTSRSVNQENLMAKAQLAPSSNEREDPLTVIKNHALLLFLLEDQLKQRVPDMPQAAGDDDSAAFDL